MSLFNAQAFYSVDFSAAGWQVS